jgi:hypothetical protein
MTEWVVVHRYAAIGGRVTDARSGKPVGVRGVQVSITAGPPEFVRRVEVLSVAQGRRGAIQGERLDRTFTAADGHFHFLDLPDGRYTLSVVAPAAGGRTAEVEVTVSRAGAARPRPAMADIPLEFPAIPDIPAPKPGRRARGGRQ